MAVLIQSLENRAIQLLQTQISPGLDPFKSCLLMHARHAELNVPTPTLLQCCLLLYLAAMYLLPGICEFGSDGLSPIPLVAAGLTQARETLQDIVGHAASLTYTHAGEGFEAYRAILSQVCMILISPAALASDLQILAY